MLLQRSSEKPPKSRWESWARRCERGTVAHRSAKPIQEIRGTARRTEMLQVCCKMPHSFSGSDANIPAQLAERSVMLALEGTAASSRLTGETGCPVCCCWALWSRSL
jgi:hypothetical protein